MIEPYYSEGGIQIWHGRCEDVLPTLDATSIDAVICDPPYGTTACAWDTPIAFDFMWRELKRVTKPAAAIVLFGSQPFTSALVMSNPTMFKYEWVWAKNRGSNFAVARMQPMKEHENILVFCGARGTYNPQMQKRAPSGLSRIGYNFDQVRRSAHQSSIAVNTAQRDELRIAGSVQQFNTEVGLHPTQKPLALLEYLILTYTNPGDTVLDFTSGSGTTPAAAKKLGRKCIAIEQELEYVEVTVSRLSQEVFDFESVP